MGKSRRRFNPLPFLIFIVGIGILLYPTASNYYNVKHQSSAIMEYTENIAAIDNEETNRLWQEAVEYNENLYMAQGGDELPEDVLKNYDDILHVADNGMLGYIDIPKISAHLPIYHGTTEGVLQKGIGHLEWSSFPTGGQNVHTVLTGHTGMPSSRLFTDLEKLSVGDRFVLQIVGEKMIYEVESKNVVLPYEIESLAIQDGEDLCTLITCTPYGVNSHRLLVRAHRVGNEEVTKTDVKSMEDIAETSARMQMLKVAAIAAGCIIILFLILLFTSKTRKKPEKAECVKEENSGQHDI